MSLPSRWDKVYHIARSAFLKGSCALPEMMTLQHLGCQVLNLAIPEPKSGSAQISEVTRPSSDLRTCYNENVFSRVGKLLVNQDLFFKCRWSAVS